MTPTSAAFRERLVIRTRRLAPTREALFGAVAKEAAVYWPPGREQASTRVGFRWVAWQVLNERNRDIRWSEVVELTAEIERRLDGRTRYSRRTAEGAA
jgi:hypothetical protein